MCQLNVCGLQALPLYPHFYDLDVIRHEVKVEKINAILSDYWNDLTVRERGFLKQQRCYMIRKYTVTRSKNFINKYIDEIMEREKWSD